MTATTYGVEIFDVSYGSALAVDDDTTFDIECELVEDGETLTTHDPSPQRAPDRLAFVDGTMRTDAYLSRTSDDGTVEVGLAGCWATGAALSAGQAPLIVDHVTCERVAVFCGGTPVELPSQPGGWSWVAVATEGNDPALAREAMRRRMRNAEGRLAEELCEDGWSTVVDGPLNNIRRSRDVPVVGYVKTHHRRMLDAANWARVPQLAPGQRSSAFAIGEDLYGCYLRAGATGPWAGPWAGIVRLEVPSGTGRNTAMAALDQAAGWLPNYASASHRDARAPVNLTPIAGLEKALRRRYGDARLAVRAVREAIVQLNNATTGATP